MDQNSNAEKIPDRRAPGAVTSLLLFNFYLSKLPASWGQVNSIRRRYFYKINLFVDVITDFLEERGSNSDLPDQTHVTVTLFTPDTHQADISPKGPGEGHGRQARSIKRRKT